MLAVKRTQQVLSLDWADRAIAALAATLVSGAGCAGLNALMDVVSTPMPWMTYPFGLVSHEARRS
jgi:hypothetical protein